MHPLNKIIFDSYYRKQREGSRKLKDNEFRISKAVGCSYELFYGKAFPKPDQGETASIRYNPHTGVVTPVMGKALAGTFIHEVTQNLLDFFIIEAETVVNYKDDQILLSGHVDMEYHRRGGNEICDIKSLASYTFDSISGESVLKPNSYADIKKKKSVVQANIYAYLSGANNFTILWIDRNSLRFKLEEFPTSEAVFLEVIDKLHAVMDALADFKNGDKDARPCVSGLQMCKYCDAKDTHCLGKEHLHQKGLF